MTATAVHGDHVLLVKALHRADGYYKPDVYLHDALPSPLVSGGDEWSVEQSTADVGAPPAEFDLPVPCR